MFAVSLKSYRPSLPQHSSLLEVTRGYLRLKHSLILPSILAMLDVSVICCKSIHANKVKRLILAQIQYQNINSADIVWNLEFIC